MSHFVRFCAALGLATALVGCASNPVAFKEDVTRRAEVMQAGPETRPMANATSFSDGLRCMDRLFVTYGVRDVSMLVEDLLDHTKKVNAGTKDMFVSAVSQMTRRSQAIRLVAYGTSTDSTLNAFIQNSPDRLSDADPEFAVRGSVSQFDEAIIKKQGDAGLNVGPVGVAGALQATSSILGLDLNVIRSRDLSLVPGVVANNSVQVLRTGVGADGEIVLRKFGANFNFVLARSEGQAQALRTLVELAAIELMGRLAKVPYWSCLGLDDSDPGVAAEIADWWESFAADPRSLIFYLQGQFRTRGVYDGEVDGVISQPLMDALRAYELALGLPGEGNLNLEFLRRYLAADHATLQDTARAYLATAPVPAVSTATSVAPAVMIRDARGPGAHRYSRGGNYSIDVLAGRDAYLYCYLIDDAHRVSQFFPNPSAPVAAVRGGVWQRFPGSQPFRFYASQRGATETLACLAGDRDLGQDGIGELSDIHDVDALAAAFARVQGGEFGMGIFDVKPD